MIHANDIVLRLDGEDLASGRSYDIELSQEYIRAAHEYARVGNVIPTTYEMHVSSECLVADYDAYKMLVQCMQSGTSVEMNIGIADATHRCSVFVESVRIVGSVNKLQVLSASFKSSGYIGEGEIPYLYVEPVDVLFMSGSAKGDEKVYSNVDWVIN